jgi:GlpG protein
MRLIGHVPDETGARRLSDFLTVEGITNEVEADKEGWAVWIHSEDQLDLARNHLSVFQRNPGDARFSGHGQRAQQLRDSVQQNDEASARRHYDRNRIFREASGFQGRPLTWILIAASVAVTLLSSWPEAPPAVTRFLRMLYISEPLTLLRPPGHLPEVLHGQIWRLLTPILIHGGLIHILFNMWCLFDLGGILERHEGTKRLALLVIVLGVGSNVVQYLLAGPRFGGMSGVLFGLVGYVWIRGKFDLTYGLFLHTQTVIYMLVWYFLCLFGLIGNIANGAHTGGLLLGMAWGFWAAKRPR